MSNVMLCRRLTKTYLAALLLVLFFVSVAFAGESMTTENIATEKESFAKEYETLKILLQKVKSKDSAVLYKPQIQQELDRLKSSQRSGDKEFSKLSNEEQQEFIKKFQNNHYHCGEVTQVMEEKRRILLNPDLNKILGPIVQNIP